jgi:hypothetical protein
MILKETAIKKDGPFDPVEYFDSKIWEIFNSLAEIELNEETFHEDPSIFIEIHSRLSILNPKKYRNVFLPEGVDDVMQRYLLNQHDGFKGSFAPDHLDLLALNEKSKQLLRGSNEQYEITALASDPLGLKKNIFPKSDLLPDVETAGYLEQEGLIALQKEKVQGPWSYSSSLAKLRFLFPEEFAQQIKITDEEWVRFREHFDKQINELGTYSNENKAVFISYCANLRILAADRLHVTENGLELEFNNREARLTDISHIPERRRF